MPREIEPPQRPIGLRALVNIVWRRRGVIALALAAPLGAAAAYLNATPPTYTATAEVMLNGRETNVVDLEQVVSNLDLRNSAANEVRLIGSERLLRRAVQRLRLDRDAELNPVILPADPDRLWQVKAAGGTITPAGSLRDRKRAETEIIDALRDRLKVGGVPSTRAIRISFQSTDPSKAALIANTLADLYISDQLEQKFAQTRHASQWLDRRLGVLRKKVEVSEAAVEAFKARQSVGPAQGSALTQQQMAELNGELIAARAASAEAEARYEQVRRRARGNDAAAAGSVVSSPMILTLRAGLADLARREAELVNRYGERHPRMIQIRSELADARAAISGEVRKIIAGLENDVAIARARETALADSLATLEDQSVVTARGSIELRQLQREADSDRLLYETFLNRFKETTEQEDLQVADARLVSPAAAPLDATSPNRKKILLLALAAGLALALGAVIALEMLATGFRAVIEVADHTGLPVIGAVPLTGAAPVMGWRPGPRRIVGSMASKPGSALAHAVRGLSGGLLGAQAPQVISITGSVPGEGVTTTALLLATSAARSGRRVAIIEGDPARPALARQMTLPGAHGMADLLTGDATLDAALCEIPATGVCVIAARRSAPPLAEILSTPRCAALFRQLRQRFDLVLIDTPPTLVSADAAALAKHADAALYAVRWAATPRSAAVQGIAQLQGMGIPVLGTVVTMVDRPVEARYAFAHYGQSFGAIAAGTRYYAR